MTIDHAKIILAEFDRLGLELADGLNLLTEAAVISDNVITFADICDADAGRAAEFLRDRFIVN